ncbi:MAG: hypothetical protein J6U72_02115 [Clostridia bacterium]|nr:hypothetical protein [Clostridia bacterium]
MKKILAILLAFLLLLASAAFAQAESENPAAGNWYADLNGIPVSLSLDPDGTYIFSVLGEAQTGAWTMSESFLLLDGDGFSPINVVSDTFMVQGDLGLFYTREPAVVYKPAGVMPASGPDWFSGYWKSLYVERAGTTALAEALGDTTDIYIEGESVALGGERFGDIWWNFTFADGTLSAELTGGEKLIISLQTDGRLRLEINKGEDRETLWLAAVRYKDADISL